MDIVTRPREKLHLCFDSGNLEGWLAARTPQFRFSTFLSVDLFGGEEEEASWQRFLLRLSSSTRGRDEGCA